LAKYDVIHDMVLT